MFVTLRLSALAGNLETLELSPALLRCLFNRRLDFDHFLHSVSDLGRLPATQLTTLKENVNLLTWLKLLAIEVVVGVVACLLGELLICGRGVWHGLYLLDHLIEQSESFFGVVCNPVNLCLIDELLALVLMLPVDDSVAEDLDPPLVVGEGGVLARDRRYHRQQVVTLTHLKSKGAASTSQLVSQLHQLVTEFPVLSLLTENFVQVVEYTIDFFFLVLVFYLHKV